MKVLARYASEHTSEKTYDARSVTARRPDPRAVLVEQERHGYEDEADEADERAGPVDAELGKHLRREQREGGRDERPDRGVDAKRGRAVVQVGVHEV